MSEIVKELPKITEYPWEEWLDGKARKLKQGVDFDVPMKGMACQCHNAGRRHNLVIKVRQDQNAKVLYLQAFPKDSTPSKRKRKAKK